MKTPKFWKNVNIISILLYPLSLLYFFVYKIRCIINKKQYKSEVPVICVGNITAGGSGKTPLAIEIAKILKNNNKKFCFLSKGYGGTGGYMVVKKVCKSDDSEIVGDEPLLLNEYGDVYISKDRVRGLKFINEKCGKEYDFIIMDDGLQNPTFYKDKKILVVNGEYGFGNKMFLPSGPLRDKIKSIKNVDLVVINGNDENNIIDLCKKYNVLYTITKTKAMLDNIDLNKEYVAFCGLGLPEKFRKTLEENKINIKDFVAFGDHYKYTKDDIEKIKELSNNLITTKKDWVKLYPKNKKNVAYLDIFLEIENKNLIEELIK